MSLRSPTQGEAVGKPQQRPEQVTSFSSYSLCTLFISPSLLSSSDWCLAFNSSMNWFKLEISSVRSLIILLDFILKSSRLLFFSWSWYCAFFSSSFVLAWFLSSSDSSDLSLDSLFSYSLILFLRLASYSLCIRAILSSYFCLCDSIYKIFANEEWSRTCYLRQASQRPRELKGQAHVGTSADFGNGFPPPLPIIAMKYSFQGAGVDGPASRALPLGFSFAPSFWVLTPSATRGPPLAAGFPSGANYSVIRSVFCTSVPSTRCPHCVAHWFPWFTSGTPSPFPWSWKPSLSSRSSFSNWRHWSGFSVVQSASRITPGIRIKLWRVCLGTKNNSLEVWKSSYHTRHHETAKKHGSEASMSTGGREIDAVPAQQLVAGGEGR